MGGLGPSRNGQEASRPQAKRELCRQLCQVLFLLKRRVRHPPKDPLSLWRQ
jgi:hypothetical protein